MRILHIATTYPLHVGDSNAVFVEAIAEGLAARNHSVHVLVPGHPDLQLVRPGRQAEMHQFRYSPLRRWHPWGYAQALTADRALRWDAYVAALPAGLATVRAARRLLAGHQFDLVHAHWLLPNAPLAAAALRDREEPLLISCHGSGVYMAERHRWAAAAARWATARCSGITACSRDLARRAGRFSPLEPEWIPYGVDVGRFRPATASRRASVRAELAARHGLSPEAPWILAVGRLVYKKGFDRLIDALPAMRRQLPDALVVIVGDGPLREDLGRQAERAGVAEGLALVGAAPHESLPDYYAAADVVAVPSVHGPGGNVDGLPNTFMEGLASGTPVVASDVAGIPDVARNGATAILVPEADSGALAAAIVELLADPDRRLRLGAAARADVEGWLSWDMVCGRFEELYERATRGEPQRTAAIPGSSRPHDAGGARRGTSGRGR